MPYLKKLFAPVTEVPPSLQSSYFPALDGLRGIAVLIVVFAHLGGNVLLKPWHIAVNSRTGVDLFFVLSGFLITTILLKEQALTGAVSLKRFYIRRVLRIVPVAYVFLLVLWILRIFFHFHVGMHDFLASAFFIKNLPMSNEPFTAHFWSLAVEVQFYLIFPALMVMNLNRYVVFALILVIGVSLTAIGAAHISTVNQYPVINDLVQLCRYVFWKGPVIILIGSLLAILLFKGIINVNTISTPSFIMGLLILLALVITSNAFIYYSKYVSEFTAALLFGAVVLLSLKGQCLLSSVLLTRLGTISYSIYIWQELFIGTRVWQPWLKFMDDYPLGLFILVKLLLLLLISFLSYYVIERTFLRLKTKFE